MRGLGYGGVSSAHRVDTETFWLTLELKDCGLQPSSVVIKHAQYHAMLDMNRFEWMPFANPLKHLTRAPSVAAGGSLRLGTYCNALTSDSWQAGAAQ